MQKYVPCIIISNSKNLKTRERHPSGACLINWSVCILCLLKFLLTNVSGFALCGVRASLIIIQ